MLMLQVEWPPGLESLTFGQAFNQRIDTEGTVWPARLKRLTFGGSFNQPVRGATWPTTLQEMTFGREFNQVSVSFSEGSAVVRSV